LQTLFMVTRRVSVIVFYDDDKRILLQDRTGIGKFNVNLHWGFFGGGIEDGETPEQTLVREVKEELGYELEDFRYIGVYQGKLNEHTIILHAFISPLGDKLSKFKQKEGAGMKMFSLDEAMKLMKYDHDRGVIMGLKKIL
jgi:8-oxo-dGTP diphosphatase